MQVTQHALLMVHRASRSVERLAQLIREKGFEPTVLASRPTGTSGIAEPFETTCLQLGLRYRLTQSGAITLQDALDTLQSLPGDYRFALSVWDGHRVLMAQVNERLGACDVSSIDMARVEDKLLTRQALTQAGLTTIRAFALSDPALPAAMDGHARFIARPRRGIGSLLTAPVTRLGEAQALNRELCEQPAEGDLFSGFFERNEIFVEDLFEGREFSLELIRSQGQTVSACWHEKTAMRVAERSIHERACASPPVSLGESELATGQAFADRVLAALRMAHGSFHVELLYGTNGRWELVEVNARPGGALVSESVYQRFGVRPSADWVDVLSGRRPASHGEPACGTYQQVAYPSPGRVIAALRRRPDVRKPDVELNALTAGGVAQAGREDYAHVGLWRTPSAAHVAEVGRLAAADYIDFQYAS